MTVYSSVACSAENGSEQWDYDDLTRQITASVILRCAVADIDALVSDLFQNNRAAPFVPHALPPIAKRVGVSYQNLDRTTPTIDQSNNWTDALISVSYGYPEKTDTTSNGIKVSEEVVPHTQVTELDYRDFRWAGQTGDPLRPAEAPGKINVRIGLTRKLYGLSLPIPFSTISLAGSCNQAAYSSPTLGFNFGAETLLYLDPKLDRTFDLNAGSGDGVNYTQNWMINPNGWNKFYREETNSWEQIYHVGSVSPHKTYPVADLSSILF